MIIIGAGLSGLLAATQFQTAQVFEARPKGDAQHRALLRFRTSAVGDAVGIEFRKVRVHKGIWRDGRYIAASIKDANQYSLKTIGRLGDRSIWNLDPVDRWIAPDDLMEQLVERVGSRIEWNHQFDFHWCEDLEKRQEVSLNNPIPEPIISTIPMIKLVQSRGLREHPVFDFKPITVFRTGVPNADVFQTVYFPSPETHVYRASITGSTLIIEATKVITNNEVQDVLAAFGLDRVGDWFEASQQSYGKIAPIDDAWRRKFIVEATRRLNVYSLGRFAVWKNILADDVLKDIAVIKRLLKGDAYAASIAGA